MSGLGNLSVFTERGKKWSGCEFMLPEYEVAFGLEEGDLLFADVHQIHCNAKLIGSGRISLVLFAREKMVLESHEITKQVLEEGPMCKNRGNGRSILK